MIDSSAYRQPGVLQAAVDWIANLLTGSVGTTVAVLGIAAVGLALLHGHLPARRAATVIAGCFVLFGARTIASGLIGLAGTDRSQLSSATASSPVPPPTAPAAPYDPWAGAAVPD